MNAYRVENQAAGHGIWRNFDGSLNPVFAKLSDGLDALGDAIGVHIHDA